MTGSRDRLFDDDVVECPHSFFAALRERDPVHRVAGTDAHLVTRLDLIKEVVADPQRFTSRTGEFLYRDEDGRAGLRPPIGEAGHDEDAFGVLATADPPDHTRHRGLLSRILSAGAINARESEFRSLVDDALGPALTTGRVEWMSAVAEPLPMLMVTRLLGVADENAPALKAQGYASVQLIGGFVSAEEARELEAKLLEIGPAIDAFSAACATADPDPSTVVGACARAVAAGDLDELEAFGILATLLAAGGESTTSLLGAGARILAEDQDLQDRLRSDLSLVPAFVEETCRIEPPFRGHYRRVVTDTTLGGVDLPAGSRLVLVWPAANRTTELGGDAIDVERPNPRQHLGFGWGLHLCVGAPLARMEARVTFERLLSRTRSFAIEPGTELAHHRSLMVRRLQTLPLTLVPAS
jgi:cytochrome P450 family 144